MRSLIRSTRPDGVLASAVPAILGTSVVAAADEVGCRLVAVAVGAAEHTHAASVQVHEVIDGAATWLDAAALLSGQSHPRPPAASAESGGKGRIVAMWGPAGAPGRTSLSIAFAAALAGEGHRVALVDADTYGASIGLSLGLLDEAPGLAAACRLAGSGGLDLAQLDRVAAHVPTRSGAFTVLTGITRPSRWPELSHDRMVDALEFTRRWADTVIVDTGFNLEADEEIVSDLFAPRRNASTLAVLEAADHVVAIGAADPVGIARLIRGYADLRDRVDPDAMSVIVNKVRRASLGHGAIQQIDDTLYRFAGIEHTSYLPYDRSAFDAALLRAVPLGDAAPKAPVTVAVTRFVREQLGSVTPVGHAESLPRVSRFAPA